MSAQRSHSVVSRWWAYAEFNICSFRLLYHTVQVPPGWKICFARKTNRLRARECLPLIKTT